MFHTPPVPSSHESRPSRFTGLRAGPAGKAFIGVVVLAMVGLAVWDIADTATSDDLTFTYVARSGDDAMDQQLLISNHSSYMMAPILSFTALSGSGDSLPGVTVTGLFGSDHGGLVVPPGENLDVLIFDGPLADQVADVRVTVDDDPTVRFPAVDSWVDVTLLDGRGLSTTRDSRISAVKLTNDNLRPVTVRLVYVVWSDPAARHTQQAETVTPIGDLIEVPADGTVTVPVTGPADAVNRAAVAGHRSASVKAYFATTSPGHEAGR
jgi:hypothetical protein